MKRKNRQRQLLAALLTAVLLLGLLALPLEGGAYAAGSTADTSETAQNVTKVLSYANQLKNANNASRSTGGFTWDTESKTRSWTYYNGLMMDAFAMMGASNYAYVDGFYNANISSNGTITNFTSGELDSVEPIRAAFDMFMNPGYTSGNSAKYKQGIQQVYTMLENQISYSSCGGNYAHKQKNGSIDSTSWATYPIALDGIYMAQPFLMECARAIEAGKLTLKNKSGQTVTADSIYNSVYSRLVWIYNNLYNSNTKLYDHAANPSGQTNGITWSRAMGWYTMALVDCIELMPEGAKKDNLIAELPRIYDGLLARQDSNTGLWYNVTAYGSSLRGSVDNRLETSGSSQFAYSMLKAYNKGYVTDIRYAQAGLRAFNGIVNNKMTGSSGNYSVIDTYISSGASTAATDYLTKSYTTNEAKGVGALIMAATLANEAAAKLEQATARRCVSLTLTGSYKTSYLSGENLDVTGLVVYANYSNGDSQIITDYTVSALPSRAGSHSITVSFEGVTASYPVLVHEMADGWVLVEQPTCEHGGAEIRVCKDCGIEMDYRSLPALAHTPVVIPAVEAGCTQDGLTEGIRCGECDAVLQVQMPVPAKGHSPVTTPGLQVSCTQDGLTEGSYCSSCGEVLTTQQVLHALGHTVVKDKGKAPSCTAEGLTEGSHCAVCGEVLIEQSTIPASGHELVTIPGFPATCTQYGMTDEIYCSVCNETIQDWELINKTGHTVEVVPGTPASCTTDGLTAGTFCSVCRVTIQKQYPIAASGHVAKVTEGHPASCTTDGITDSSVCYFCGIVLQEAEVLSATGHVEVIDPAVEPTGCYAQGHSEGSHCGVCGTILKPFTTIPALGHTNVVDSGVNTTCTTSGWTAGTHCAVCGEITQPRIFIPVPGHAERIDPYTAPTCTEVGHTEGSHCVVCGEVFTAQEDIPATGHSPVVDEAIAPSCSAIGYTEGSHCAVCGRILKMQMVVNKTPHSYEVHGGKLPTIFTDGYTASITCRDCGNTVLRSIRLPSVASWFGF